MKYLITVNTREGNKVFEFNTKEERQVFLNQIENDVNSYTLSEKEGN